ncbi:hypothetical protein D3C76_1220440 [compost metagenome]
MAVIGNTFGAIIRRIINLLITLRQRNTGDVGVILDNDVGFFIQCDRVTQPIGVQVMRFCFIAINHVISIMLISIIDSRIIYRQAESVVLRMHRTIFIRAIGAFRGHALRGNHSIDGAIRNA